MGTITAGECGPPTPPFEAEDAGNGYSARLWTGSCRYRASAWDGTRERSQGSNKRKLGARKQDGSLGRSLHKSAAEVGERHLLGTDESALACSRKCWVAVQSEPIRCDKPGRERAVKRVLQSHGDDFNLFLSPGGNPQHSLRVESAEGALEKEQRVS